MTIKIMTYNMLHIDDNPENDWHLRKGLISTIIQREKPDIIGTQECLFSQIKDIIALNDELDWLGLGRRGGSKDDYMAIFYRKDRFEVLAYDHFWLSDTPYDVGSMTFGNEWPRMVTWIHFFDKKTGNNFYHMNTHFDHISEASRFKSAYLINNKVKEFGKNDSVFLTGDFNCDAGTSTYQILTEEGPFTDTWELARENKNKTSDTKNNLHPDPGGERIDWILVRNVSNVNRIKINTDLIGGDYPSDHFPVTVECQL